MLGPVTPYDEVFHAPADDGCWNESLWFSFNVPERDLNGFVYIFYNARLGLSGGGPAIWDPTGEEMYDCLYYDWNWLQPTSHALAFDHFALSNGTRHQMVEPLRLYRVTYENPRCCIDLEWRALMDPHDLVLDGEMREASERRHFDQAGTVRGVITLDGTEIVVDGVSLRDHTWGPQHFDLIPAGDYLWAVASEESSWHALTFNDSPGDDDRVVGGYLLRDGIVGDLVSGRRRVAARRRGAPVEVHLEARDHLGRRLRAVGRPRNVLRWMGWPGQLTNWTLTSWEWDGRQGWGEDQEFFPLGAARSLVCPR